MGIQGYVYPNRKGLETQNDAMISKMYPSTTAIVSSTAQHKTRNSVDSVPNSMVGKDNLWIGIKEEKLNKLNSISRRSYIIINSSNVKRNAKVFDLLQLVSLSIAMIKSHREAHQTIQVMKR